MLRMKMLKKWALPAAAAVLLWAGAALADVTVTADRTELPAGGIVTFTVEAGADARTAAYAMTRNGKRVFSGKDTAHFSASFRPREEGDYELTVTVSGSGGEKEETSVKLRVTAAEAAGEPAVWSQKDGWWSDKKYRRSTLDESGCAIFTLAHALRLMGYSGDAILPETLADVYGFCLGEDGTNNGRLIREAAAAFDFMTENDLLEQKTAIAEALKNGDLFTFSVANGHIALCAGISGDGKMVKILDSAPSATFERIKNASLHVQGKDGSFTAVKSLDEIPGARWYCETDSYGGLEYWLSLDYVARRGVRLIRPQWLYLREGGRLVPVTAKALGSAETVYARAGTEGIAATMDLYWKTEGSDAPKLAVISRKSGTALKNAAGKKLASVPACTILPVTAVSKKTLAVIYDGQRGTISTADAELADVIDTPVMGTVTINGKATGRAEVRVRFSPAGKVTAEWATGTRAAVLAEEKGYLQVEAKGLRVWIDKDYFTPDAE